MCNIDENLKLTVPAKQKSEKKNCRVARNQNLQDSAKVHIGIGGSGFCAILQKLDEGTLLEVLLRLRLADICRSAVSCKTFAKIARSEWLWQQMCGRNGITTTEVISPGWRAMYTSLRQVRAVNWCPRPMVELSRLADMLRGIGIPAGHAMICTDLQISSSASDPLAFTATHPVPFSFEGVPPIISFS